MNWTDKDVLMASRPPVTTRATGRLRIKTTGQNKTEQAYEAHLEAEKRVGDVVWFKYEGLTLLLAADCRFTPDFAVMTSAGALEVHDCKRLWKGHTQPHIEDDAMAKLKMAAALFPFVVRVVWPEGQGWNSRTF